MIKYLQRTRTDCLVAALENLIDHPREDFESLLEYVSDIEGNKYCTYKGVAKVLSWKDFDLLHRRFRFHSFVWAGWGPFSFEIGRRAIVGVKAYANRNHALFFDGEELYDPYNGEKVCPNNFRVVYSIAELRPNRSWHCAIQQLSKIEAPTELNTGVQGNASDNPAPSIPFSTYDPGAGI